MTTAPSPVLLRAVDLAAALLVSRSAREECQGCREATTGAGALLHAQYRRLPKKSPWRGLLRPLLASNGHEGL